MGKVKIIAFEGLDCSFKETNSKRLKEYLEDQGYKVKFASFPNYEGESSYFIREFLKGNYKSDKILGMSPETIAMFFALDRFDTFNKELKDFYLNEENEDKRIIVFDRYVKSNYYQAAQFDTEEVRANMIMFINQMEYGNMCLPVEDICVYMRMPYNLSRIIRAKKTDKDINETDEELMKNVYNLYDSVFTEYFASADHVAIVECGNEETEVVYDKETIFNDVKEKVMNLLNRLYEFDKISDKVAERIKEESEDNGSVQ